MGMDLARPYTTMDTIGKTYSPWMFFRMAAHPPLAASTRADVCVVGGGLAAVSAAYLLARKGRRVVVVSASPLGSGTTARTTAHVTSAIDDRYYEIERLHGEAGARIAAESHAAAIEAIAAIVAQESIDCAFSRIDGYLFLPPDGDPDVLEAEHAAALRAGVEGVSWAASAPIAGFDTGRCLRFPRQAQLHPLKLLAGLADSFLRDGGRIHCGTRVTAIEGGRSPRVRTAAGPVIECADVVVATQAPIHPSAALHARQAPCLDYAIAARVARRSVVPALFWDTLDASHDVRLDEPGGELLIVGGECQRTEDAGDATSPWTALEAWMRERFPAAREVLHRWNAEVMQTADGLALLGRDPGEEHVYLSTGDSGMGMTHAMIGAILITDLVHGATPAWAALYDPARRVPQRAVAAFAHGHAGAGAMAFAPAARPPRAAGRMR
jgi:glycine/D-amino acid oxidase-like deaminating enzyme